MSIIKCDKINFSYEKERTILEDISFAIEENESVQKINAEKKVVLENIDELLKELGEH